jgi:hypothetical protein
MTDGLIDSISFIEWRRPRCCTEDDEKFGLLWQVNDDMCLCGEASMSEMHRYHLKCIRYHIITEDLLLPNVTLIIQH